MSRAPRIEFAGVIYHVMNRGDRFEPIFEADSDRRMFLRTLAETCRSAGWHAHSFGLMRNHYHLLVETQRASLFMTRLNARLFRPGFAAINNLCDLPHPLQQALNRVDAEIAALLQRGRLLPKAA